MYIEQIYTKEGNGNKKKEKNDIVSTKWEAKYCNPSYTRVAQLI